MEALRTPGPESDAVRADWMQGNLLSREDCLNAARDVSLVLHLAASVGGADFAESYRNSVVTTRNLLEALALNGRVRRFVNVSSLAVYSNAHKPRWRVLDESCPVETQPALRGDPYCFAKVKQDELVTSFCKDFGIPYVLVRPGAVYGPGKDAMNGLVGTNTFGFFLHLGGSNKIPFTHVDNCADAIVQAGLQEEVDGETFNVIDDDLPSSRRFLREYKQKCRPFRSFYVPHAASYLLCYLWERYSALSQGQLPPAFNRRRWHVYWKKTHFDNTKAKQRLAWTPQVRTVDGFKQYFEARQRGEANA